ENESTKSKRIHCLDAAQIRAGREIAAVRLAGGDVRGLRLRPQVCEQIAERAGGSPPRPPGPQARLRRHHRAAEDDLDAQRAAMRQAVETGTPPVAAALRVSPRSPVGRATREAFKDKSGADRPAAGPGASGPARQGEDT